VRAAARLLLGILFVLLLMFLLAVIAFELWTGRLWYRSVGFSSVYSVRLRTQSMLFVAFGLLMALATALNAWLAYRLRPPLSAMSFEQRHLERYRTSVARHRARALVAVAMLPGLVAGAAAAAAWKTWLAAANSTPFGSADPQFHRDISFYVFQLPWYRFLVDFGLVALAVSALTAALVHYLYGGIRMQGPGRLLSYPAQGHLGVLLGLLVGLKAVAYWLDRYSLAVKAGADRAAGGWNGVGYTEANAVLPAKAVMCGIAVICAVLFLATPLRRTWALPLAALALMAFSSVLIGSICPALVQQFQVKPDAQAKEAPYAARNSAATEAAYGISGYIAAAAPRAGALASLPASPSTAASGASSEASSGTSSGTAAQVPVAAADARQRVQAVAPWLRTGADLYQVTVGGRTEWVVDGYTTSDSYPFAARAGTAMGGGAVDYIRDAVKATVDVSSGAVTLYQWDTVDPVLRTWMRAFPGTVRPYATIGAGLKSELRYPQELFVLQRDMLGSG
jgi:uncharacterized membrane protein (UPF0182 family)